MVGHLTVELIGGLGNQLFQLAALMHIASRTGRRPYLQSLANPSPHSSVSYFDTIFWRFRSMVLTGHIPIRIEEPSNTAYTEWRTMLRPVYAKASLNPNVSNRFVDDIYELYSAHIYDAESNGEDASEPLRFARDDMAAPHWPLIVPFSQAFVDFDPGRLPDQLTQSFYEQTFRPFLLGLEAAMLSGKTASGSRA